MAVMMAMLVISLFRLVFPAIATLGESQQLALLDRVVHHGFISCLFLSLDREHWVFPDLACCIANSVRML